MFILIISIALNACRVFPFECHAMFTLMVDFVITTAMTPHNVYEAKQQCYSDIKWKK